MNENEIIVWPAYVSHIVIEKGSYKRGGNSVESVTWKVYIEKCIASDCRPDILVLFEGTHDSLIAEFSKLDKTKVDENTSEIKAETIMKAAEEGTFDPYLGSKGAWDDNVKPMCRGFIFGNLPLDGEDGKQQFKVYDKDGKEMLREKTHQPILQTHIDVVAQVVYHPALKKWIPIKGKDMNEALRIRVQEQLQRDRYKLYDPEGAAKKAAEQLKALAEAAEAAKTEEVKEAEAPETPAE